MCQTKSELKKLLSSSSSIRGGDDVHIDVMTFFSIKVIIVCIIHVSDECSYNNCTNSGNKIVSQRSISSFTVSDEKKS